MSILTVSNLKGGVGKTTLAVNIAHAFAQRHCETLLIDLDLQGDASQFIRGQSSGSAGHTLATQNDSKGDCFEANEISSGGGKLFHRLVNHAREGIHEIRPGFSILSGETVCKLLPLDEEGSSGAVADLLAKLVEALSVRFDNVVIDTPPSWGVMHEGALQFSSLVIVPVDPSEMSVRAAISLLNKISAGHAISALLVRTMVSRMATSVASFAKKKLESEFEQDSRDAVDAPKEVTLKGLNRSGSDERARVLRVYLSNTTLYRSELVHKLSYSHKTVFEQRGLEHLRDGYALLAKEAELVIGLSEPGLDDAEDYGEFMHDTFAGSLVPR